MEKRVYNFSPGPATLPLSVLQEAQRDLLALPGLGVSALEISHRCPWFDKVLEETEANLRELLKIPANFKVLFLQGGSRLQFSMVPMNLLQEGHAAEYIVTGSWRKMALHEAKKFGAAKATYDTKATNYDRLPTAADLKVDAAASYAYFTSNETIQGVQFLDEPTIRTCAWCTRTATSESIPRSDWTRDSESTGACRPAPTCSSRAAQDAGAVLRA